MSRNILSLWFLVIIGFLFSSLASASCKEPYLSKPFGLWKDGDGMLNVHFSEAEARPYVGRLQSVSERLRRVGYRVGYPIIVMYGDSRAVWYGSFAKRNAQGKLPSSEIRVQLVNEQQRPGHNELHIAFKGRNGGWQTRHTLSCSER